MFYNKIHSQIFYSPHIWSVITSKQEVSIKAQHMMSRFYIQRITHFTAEKCLNMLTLCKRRCKWHLKTGLLTTKGRWNISKGRHRWCTKGSQYYRTTKSNTLWAYISQTHSSTNLITKGRPCSTFQFLLLNWSTNNLV